LHRRTIVRIGHPCTGNHRSSGAAVHGDRTFDNRSRRAAFLNSALNTWLPGVVFNVIRLKAMREQRIHLVRERPFDAMGLGTLGKP
jgi:predicted kinase